MSRTLLITFKAGRCLLDDSTKPYKVTCDPEPGYIYLYNEDDLIHFCWRPRGNDMDNEDNLDLMMPPADGHFEPYDVMHTTQSSAKTNGRIFTLKFESSSQRHLFWLQSKAQGPNNDPSHFSPRDLSIGQIVDRLLQSEEVDVEAELVDARSHGGGRSGGNDEDEPMEDVEGEGNASHNPGSSGGAGPGATGGDVREEGSSARDGGADGGRAAGSGTTDAATIVQNFLNSLKGGQVGQSTQQEAQGQIYTTLPDLLPSEVTVSMIDKLSPDHLDNLLSFLPPAILLLEQEGASSTDNMAEPSTASGKAAMEALSPSQKKSILKRVVRSPQFHQSLGSLTMAIRDGGLPSIAEALKIKLEHGGLVRGGSMPLGGGDAVEAFIEGVKKTVEKK